MLSPSMLSHFQLILWMELGIRSTILQCESFLFVKNGRSQINVCRRRSKEYLDNLESEFHSFCCFSFICFKTKYRQQQVILFLNVLLIVCFQTFVQDSSRKYPEHPKIWANMNPMNDPGPNTFNNEQ